MKPRPLLYFRSRIGLARGCELATPSRSSLQLALRDWHCLQHVVCGDGRASTSTLHHEQARMVWTSLWAIGGKPRAAARAQRCFDKALASSAATLTHKKSQDAAGRSRLSGSTVVVSKRKATKGDSTGVLRSVDRLLRTQRNAQNCQGVSAERCKKRFPELSSCQAHSRPKRVCKKSNSKGFAPSLTAKHGFDQLISPGKHDNREQEKQA